MGSPSRYWRLVKLDVTGQRRVEEVADAKRFFQQQFAEFIGQFDVPDLLIQRQCIEWMRQVGSDLKDRTDYLAEICLRCYISHQIDAVCQQLAAQFGSQHGFSHRDLLPYVLDDVGLRDLSSHRSSSTYRSLATKILDNYDPSKAALSTWVNRLVRQQDELEQFLLEQGVYLISDWAILNDTQPKQLTRILSEFYSLSKVEIEQAMNLLQSYHAIYRRARILQRQTQAAGRCQPPTLEQLIQIAQTLAQLQPASSPSLQPEAVLEQLQTLATQLRQYRIAVRKGGTPQFTSIEDPALQTRVNQMQAPDLTEDTEAQNDLMQRYREIFLNSLDTNIELVTGDRLTTLPRKRTPSQFLTALHLLHCRGFSMTEIAPRVGLGGQSQVSRLLQLPEFRTDIRQRWLAALCKHVPELVREFESLDRLQGWDQRLEQVLQEEVETVIQATVAEVSAVRHRPLTSLFALRLCHFLDALGEQINHG
ncbi:hypothetical protein IFO70_23470 [Phormidium tenue FACHB-886]|nr:hypothetical protein [Phormidium tenue FACHB-886]